MSRCTPRNATSSVSDYISRAEKLVRSLSSINLIKRIEALS
jgi:hypothetical protein